MDFICNRSNLLGTKVGKHQIIKDRLLQRLPKIWFPEKKEKEEGKYNFIKTSYDIRIIQKECAQEGKRRETPR